MIQSKRFRIGSLATLAILLLFSASAQAQIPPVKNPTGVTFTSADHAQLTGYEVDIVKTADGSVLQTIQVAKSATTVQTNGDIKITLNVQPITFGTYTLRIRAVAGTLLSPNSPSSDPWERSPGAPSKGTVQ